MAKSLEETFAVSVDQSQMLDRCQAAMEAAGFRKVSIDRTQGHISGRYRTAATAGKLDLTVRSTGGQTEVTMRATAAADALSSLFRSPNEKIIRAFKDQLAQSQG